MKRISDTLLQNGKTVDINMSPLIDCVFLLLIFFIVSTVFVKEAGVEITRPRAVSAEQLDRSSILIALTADNRIFYEERELALNSVRGLVARQLRAKERPVILLADELSQSGPLVELIDECKLAGAEQVSVATRNGMGGH